MSTDAGEVVTTETVRVAAGGIINNNNDLNKRRCGRPSAEIGV